MRELIWWLVLSVGVVTVIVATLGRSRFKVQEGWIETRGVVTASGVTLRDELFAPEIRYSYAVSGQDFVGETVRSGLVCYNWRGPAEKICKRYAVGTPVRVYVDPKDPTNAVLERGGDRVFTPLLYGVAALLIVVAGLLLTSE